MIPAIWEPISGFSRFLIMHAPALYDFTQMDLKDVVSAGGKLIIGSPYNN
jgi:hypothetical protein